MDIKSKEKTMIILAVLATVSITISLFILSQGLERADDTSIISGSMPLLAVSTGSAPQGGIAYLDLKIIDGEGAVYVHAEPFTRVDTQATTRFAKQYACSVSKVDCEKYDFLYSIRSDAPIVGGPSAGAAMTALTITLLEGKSFPPGVSITGSISSGGIIGSVGGIDEKIEAARKAGIRTVIIPMLSNYSNNNTGSLNVIPANTVEEALSRIDETYMFDRKYDIIVPESYTETMNLVARNLCDDNREQYEQIKELPLPYSNRINASLELVEELIIESENADMQGLHYTQASHCFNARTRIHYLRLSSQMRSIEDIGMRTNILKGILDMAKERASREYQLFLRDSRNDINGIQIKSIVKERYDESIDRIGEIERVLERESMTEDDMDELLFEMGYTIARIDSMISWISFSGYEKSSMQVSNSAMRSLCTRKISEANERSEYVEYATGTRMIDISDAYSALSSRDYDECIYKASLHKARADMIMSRISTSAEKIPELIAAKRVAAEHAIAKQSVTGVFPVMAYSYLEYAESLREENPEIALLYYENAIELSGLSSYFEEERKDAAILRIMEMQRTYAFLLFLGLALGFSLSMIIMGMMHDKKPVARGQAYYAPKKKGGTIKKTVRKTVKLKSIKR